jgi:hypothetical protein
MVHLMGKPPMRRGRVVIDIRGLNKISEHDAYPMPLQSDILSKAQGCPYISVMDCAVFFHQGRVAITDRHKLTVVSHRGAEQWNVGVMGHRNTTAYVQREMDYLFRDYPFAKAYIDDVVVFSHSSEEHLEHLEKVFAPYFAPFHLIRIIRIIYTSALSFPQPIPAILFLSRWPGKSYSRTEKSSRRSSTSHS